MARDWIETEATIATAQERRTRTGPLYVVSFRYAVEGATYSGSLKTRTPYEPGDHMPVRYDPRQPGLNNYDAKAQNARRTVIVFFSLAGMVVLSVLLLMIR